MSRDRDIIRGLETRDESRVQYVAICSLIASEGRLGREEVALSEHRSLMIERRPILGRRSRALRRARGMSTSTSTLTLTSTSTRDDDFMPAHRRRPAHCQIYGPIFFVRDCDANAFDIGRPT